MQKHSATTLHYDLRLEHAGVLLSWAVPKGPSLNPKDKRLAMRTEDHPLKYADFEGVIPSGYGEGVMLVWDQGTWKPDNGDVSAALKKGELKFTLDGVKLKGSWVLVRTRRHEEREQWLLIKHKDHWSGDVDVAAAAPRSVKSDRDLAEVLAQSSQKPGSKQAAMARARTAGAAEPTAKPRAAKTPKLSARALRVDRSAVKFTNRDKPLYSNGFTKGDLIDYYVNNAKRILPFTIGRAVTLKRFPNGMADKVFFEKRCPSHRPDWVKTARVMRSDGEEAIDYCTLDSADALAWVANLAAIELHVPLALADAPDTPTHLVFDLDPGPPAGIAECRAIALQLREMLKQLKLDCCVKTSGSKGIHLFVPLNDAKVSFDQTKQFSRAVAMLMEKQQSDRVIATQTRSRRPGKVLIDWSQNDRNKTTVCTWSMRGTDEPSISRPISWKELTKLKTARFDPAKADQVDDAEFLRVYTKRQTLPGL